MTRSERVNPRERDELRAWALGVTRERLLAHPELLMLAAPAPRRRLARALARRAAGEPLEYIVGHASFYGRDFGVTPAVLIPRPATELVLGSVPDPLRTLIVDVGTGSGAVAVTLALDHPRARVIATDVSTAALAVARRNARTHGVARRIIFKKGALLAPVKTLVHPNTPLVIVANLPYVPTRAARANRFEPQLALDGGPDGLKLYHALVKQLIVLRRHATAPTTLYAELLPAQYAPLAREIKKRAPGATVARITVPGRRGKTLGLMATLKAISPPPQSRSVQA